MQEIKVVCDICGKRIAVRACRICGRRVCEKDSVEAGYCKSCLKGRHLG